MDELERIALFREYIDTLKERIDNIKMSEEDNEILSLFLQNFELMLEDREVLFRIIERIKPNYQRMNDIVGTEENTIDLNLLNKLLEKR